MEVTTGIALYAAGVSTVVAAQQIAREFPSVRVRTLRDASIRHVNQPPEPILILDVVNAGRRRVTINMVAFSSPRHFLEVPSIWVQEWPFTLGDGDAKTLTHPENGTIPADAVFAARDSLGRWWPRQRRVLIWYRRHREKRRARRAR
jgi:hypothetical protein